MPNKLFTLLLILFPTLAFGQTGFEKGLIILENNDKIECVIKNYNWVKPPKQLEYSVSDSGMVQSIDISAIKSFEIENSVKYIQVTTSIDRSSAEFSYISIDKNPFWSVEKLLLKVIVEGEASLYYYQDLATERFFYKVGEGDISQLVYKQYTNQNDRLLTNSTYKSQLAAALKCPNDSVTPAKNIGYNRKDLEKYFKQYNECSGSIFKVFKYQPPKNLFHVSLKPGNNLTEFSIEHNKNKDYDFNFTKQYYFQIGVEAEYLLPFAKRKWGITAEPTYQFLDQSTENSIGAATIEFHSIDFPFGIKHHFYLNKYFGVFLNANIIPGAGFVFNSSVALDYSYSVPVQLKTKVSFSVGGGLKYKKLSTEFRYYTDRKLIANSDFWSSGYTRLALLVGFIIF